MIIPLNEFEQHIHENILKKGLTYYKKGAIQDFVEISFGEYEAIVSGTEDYTVQLTIKNNLIVEHNCDCPYDLGPICKHIVAAIFYIQKDTLDLNKTLHTPPKKKEKTISVSQQIKELLKTINHDELIRFVEENCKKDKKFSNYFLASFGHLSSIQSKAFYQKQIQSILKSAAGKNGWIGWSDMKYVMNATQPFLENAEQYFQKKKFENVFYISTSILEEMTKALQFADDSNGEIGYFIHSSMEFLSKTAKENTSESLKKGLFDYCISAFKTRIFEGWDWHLGIIHLAGDIVENENDADVILTLLDTVRGEYEKENAQLYKLELLRKYKNQKIVDEFIHENISNPKIRKLEIEYAFENHHFEKIKTLAIDGILLDEEKKPGLVKEWYDWLLKIALLENNKSNIIKFARYRLINNFRGTEDYYQILKDNVEPSNWHPFLEEIISDVTPKNRWKYVPLVRQIYINEAWWDRLLLMLKENLSLENIEENEIYLAKDYSTELIELYSERITNYVNKYVGRNYYQSACRYLRRMKKLGGNQQVNELIEIFRKQYPQRKALMEELLLV